MIAFCNCALFPPFPQGMLLVLDLLTVVLGASERMGAEQRDAGLQKRVGKEGQAGFAGVGLDVPNPAEKKVLGKKND